jgi:two-component system osmolarity sensor histidine kinase EnvZ
VFDRGPGIPEVDREAVFRPFHRLEASRSARTGGSGLRLAIVRQLAAAHGRELSLQGRSGGWLEIPLQQTGLAGRGRGFP